MPILIKEYEWDQSDEHVSLTFLLPSSQKNINVFVTSSYLKVNISPYFFEAFLYHSIDPSKATYEISNGRVLFNLPKQVFEVWDKFSLELCKEVARDARILANREHEENLKKSRTQKKDEKRKVNDAAITRQISLNEDRLQKQKDKLEAAKMEFFKNSEKENRSRTSSVCSDGSGALSEGGGYDGDIEETTNAQKGKVAPSSPDQGNTSSKKPKKRILKPIPKIRPTNVVKVRMTPRNFPTPSRESTAAEEKKILSQVDQTKIKQSDSTEKCAFFTNKALELFKGGDFNGCVNAFNEAIKMSPNKASLYSNRAAGYLALHAYQIALDDCTKALDLLTPPNKENEKSRLLCYIRKGTALVHLNKFDEGLQEYYKALKLDPNNALLRRDIATIESYNSVSSDTGDCEEATDDETDLSSNDSEEEDFNGSFQNGIIHVEEISASDLEESESASR